MLKTILDSTVFLFVWPLMFGIVGEILSRVCTNMPLEKAWPYLLITGFAWGSQAPAWWLLYRRNNFLMILCTYTPLSIALYALTGVVVFGDRFTPQIGIATILAIACVAVMTIKF